MSDDYKNEYYILHFHCPSICSTLEDAVTILHRIERNTTMTLTDKELGVYKWLTKVNHEKQVNYHLLEFPTDKALCTATWADFDGVKMQPTKFSHLFSSAHKHVVDVNLEFVPKLELELALKKFRSKVESEFMTFEEQDQNLQTLESNILDHISLLEIPRFHVGEQSKNNLLKKIIADAVTEYGFYATSESVILGLDNSHTSRFFNSRPDLVIYHEECLHTQWKKPTVVVNMCESEAASAKGDDEERRGDGEKSLQGKFGPTEEEAEISLVGCLKKIAGDLLYRHFNSCMESISNLSIYGLIFCNSTNTCNGYRLDIDFSEHSCVVHHTSDQLSISAGVNQLISMLIDSL